MPAPQQATISQTPITWNDGTTRFDGWALFVLSLPVGYTVATVANQNPPQQIAQRMRINIVNGIPDSAARINYNSSIDPPGSQYAVWIYDGNDTLIGQPGSSGNLFIVNSGVVNLPNYTLTKPVTTSALPTFP